MAEPRRDNGDRHALKMHERPAGMPDARNLFGATAELRKKARMALLAKADEDGGLLVGPEKANGTTQRLGRPVEWTERDRAVLELIAGVIDRKTGLSARYAETDDTKTMVKVSAELRLLETTLARLLRQVETEPPQLSRRSQQAQRAARARWDRPAGA